MKVFLGADHRGFQLKESLETWLKSLGEETVDLGAQEVIADDDFVDYAKNVAEMVSSELSYGSAVRGILICGSGVGADIVANKIKGVRCGLGLSKEQIASARKDDDITILAIASDFTSLSNAKEMTRAFLETPFSGLDRYQHRIEKIHQLEQMRS